MTFHADAHMTILDPYGWHGGNNPKLLEAFVDAISLVYELSENPECPLFQECLNAAEQTLLHAQYRGDETTVGLTTKLWELRQRVLGTSTDEGSLQSYVLDVMLSMGIGLLIRVQPVSSGAGG